ncbi:phage tail tape measure protein [Secundilactobacillus collinoides]|uniref:phage tail tape measure protein n=1 Tax=Secundilactobacillus collinoides TaxID=33960 RepID=UPI0007AEB4BD|nr:phage tail tape measure protein [Secundilactobacillus collinoides]
MTKISNTLATEVKLNTVSATSSLKSLNNAIKATTNAWKANETALKSSGDYLKAAEEKYKGISSTIEVVQDKVTKLKDKQQSLDTSTKEGSEQYAKLSTQLAQAENKLSSLNAQQTRAKNSMEYYKSGLGDLQHEYKSINEVTKSYVASLEAQGNKAQAGKAKLTGLKDSYSNLASQLKIQKAELDKVKSASGENSEAYSKQKVRVNETTTALAKQKTEMLQLTGKYGSMSDKMAKFSDKATNTRKSIVNIGQAFKTVAVASGAAVVSMAAATVKGAKDASTLQNIYKQNENLLVTSGDSTKEAIKSVTEMQKDGQKYSIKYGVSQKTIAENYQDLIKRGHTAKEALAVMKTELQGSVASGDDFNDVTKVSSQVIEAFGMKTNNTAKMVKNTKRVVNDLAYSADTTATNFHDLGKGMEYVGDSANNAGFSVEETSSALGELSNHGLEADKAGTGLRKTITSLAKPSSSATAALKEIGISSTSVFKTSNGNFKSLTSIMGTLEKHTKNLGGAQKAAVFKAIFGSTGMAAAQILAKNSDALGKLTDKVTKAGKAGEYVQKLANKNADTAQMNTKQFKEAGSALETMMGAKLLPVMTKATQDMAKAFNNKEVQKGLTATISGIAKLAGGLLKIVEFSAEHAKTVGALALALGSVLAVSKIARFIAATSEAMETIKGLTAAQWLYNAAMDANPVGIAVVAIAALGAAFYEAYKHIKPFREAVNKVTSAVGKWASGTFKTAEKAIASFGSAVKKSVKGIGEFFTGKLGWEEAIAKAIGKMASGAKKAFKPVTNVFKTFVSGVKKVFSGFAKVLEIILVAPIALEVGLAIIAWKKIKKPIISVVDAIKSGVSKGFKAVKKVVATVWDDIVSLTKTAWQLVRKYVVNPITSVYEAVEKYIVKLITKAIKTTWDTLKDLTHDAWLLIRKYIVNPIKYIWNIVDKYIVTTIVKYIKAAWEKLEDLTHDAWLLIEKYTVDPIKSAYKTVTKWIEKLLDTIKDVLGSIKSVWSNIWGDIADTFKDVWKNIKSIASDGINDVISILNTGIGGIDSVIHAFGGKKKAINTISKVHLSTGTGVLSGTRKAIIKPTMAVLNDGNDSPETGNKEAVFLPNGQSGIVQGRNTKAMLPAGTEVLNASETKLFMGMQGVTHYAKGSTNWFSSFLSGIGDVSGALIKKTASLKKYFTEAEKIIAHPTKTLDSMFSYTKAGTGVVADITKGMFNDVKKSASSWWSSLWSSIDLDGTSGATGSGTRKKFIEEALKLSKAANYKYSETKGRLGPNYYDCSGLVYEALKHIGVTLPGSTTVPEYDATKSVSWKNAVPGDLAFWGAGGDEHVGIVTSTNGNGRMWNAENPTDGIKYGPIKGFMSGFAGLRRVSQLNGGKSDDATSSKTSSTSSKALKATVGKGFFSFMSKLADLFGSNSTNSSTSAKPTGDHMHWLKEAGIPKSAYDMYNYIINKESSWNYKATNSSTGAYGLPQSLPANKMARDGSDWKTNPITQLKWMKWYVNHGNYSSITEAYNHEKSYGWYANGGISRVAQLAHISEGNKTESIIPWDISKRGQAYKIMDTTLKNFAQTDGTASSTTTSTTDISALVDQGKQMITLLSSLLSGQSNPTPAVVSANDVYNGYNKIKKTKNTLSKLGKGEY